jgi:hypothetical protein
MRWWEGMKRRECKKGRKVKKGSEEGKKGRKKKRRKKEEIQGRLRREVEIRRRERSINKKKQREMGGEEIRNKFRKK